MLAVEKRFIFGFGLTSSEKPDIFKNWILICLDTWHIEKGWSLHKIKSELPHIGCQLGILPLSKCEILVFGGIPNEPPFDLLNQAGILKLDLEDVSQSEIKILRDPLGSPDLLPVKDRFYFN